jgi:tetratricopeptide (TPR) repeat protein
MTTIPTLPSNLVVKTIFHSIESLGFANIARKALSGEKTEPQPKSILNTSSQKIYLQGLKDLEKNDLYGAIKKFTCVIKVNPKFASAYNDRGIARYKLGYKQSALEDLTIAIGLNPYKAKYYSNRGFMLTRLEDYIGAIADYNSALLLNPNLAQAYFNRGAIRLQMENSLAALADFESAIRLDPDFAKAYYNRGMTRYKLRDARGGFEDFQKAAELFKQQGRMDYYQDATFQIQQLCS